VVLTRFQGLFAAVVTPVHDDGRLDLSTFDRVVDFLVAAGVDGICITGATGEFPHVETADRLALIRRAGGRLPRDRALLVGIGAVNPHRVVELGAASFEAGSRAVLLSMPMFFRYQQEDLQAFSSHVSRALRGPCLLYDLPDFTNGLAPETVLSLLRDEAFIVGIKDSSGRVENLETFASARGAQPWTLLVGDDRALRPGLLAGWDGGISGVAGFCPELLVGLHRSVLAGDEVAAARFDTLLEELIARIAVFPTPWGIRAGLAARGLATGPFPLPLSPTRERQVDEFQEWFPAWLERTGLVERASVRSAQL
jgi:4-hydroxy-tetrahydrodipicolinate synthase